jgi:hypothetical protein
MHSTAVAVMIPMAIHITPENKSIIMPGMKQAKEPKTP